MKGETLDWKKKEKKASLNATAELVWKSENSIIEKKKYCLDLFNLKVPNNNFCYDSVRMWINIAYIVLFFFNSKM